jgi:thioredoxin 1
VTADTRPLLAFFRSERSGPARRMDSLIAHLARKERERLRVTVVDVERRPELAERFGVTSVPTLVLVKERRVVGRLEGRVSAPRINRMLTPHLEVVHVEATVDPVPAVA